MIRSALLTFALLQPLGGATFAVLPSGFRMQIDKWERSGEDLTLFHAGGTTTVAAKDVVEFIEEADAVVPPLPLIEKPAPVVPVNPKAVIAEMAASYGLPEKFVASVARAESGYKTNAVSNKGAIGVMQLMPGTAKELGVDPEDVRQNIEGGTKLLRDLLVKYQNDPDQVRKALAAYNAGSGAVAKYGGIPPYAETQQYVNKVLREYQQK